MRAPSVSRPARRLPFRRRGQRGVVLIEVLVALLVFMFGILGFIGLQTGLTRAEAEADMRANAAYLASELIGRMWVDIGNLNGYVGTTSCSASSCTEWRNKLTQLLPSGTASITLGSGTSTGDVTIRIQWTLPGGVTHSYETQSTVSAKASS